MKKRKILFGSATNTSGETIVMLAQADWSIALQEYCSMDVVINVKTFSGTSMTFSIQELIDGTTVFLETAKSAAITATGVYGFSSMITPNATLTNTSGPFPMLGRGHSKRVVTVTSSVAAIVADIYFIFYNEG